MKTIIGIPAFNEEKNIGKLLDFLIKDIPKEINSIYVVSSGSTDRTDAIVISRQEKNPTISLVSEPVRGGKSSAVNTILSKGKDHDAIVCIDADHLPTGSSIKLIVESLKNDRLGVVSGRLIPVDDASKLQGFCVHLTYNLHHLISLDTPKISGEFMAFRTKVVTKLLPMIVNDDVYIQMIFKNKGYEVGYCPEAKVYLKGPSTVVEFFQQRRRIFIGHHQIRQLFGRVAPTMKWPGWKAIFRACPIKGMRAKFYLLIFLALQGSALLFSMWDFLIGRVPYKWAVIESTKSIRS
ncbi:MAG: glycosyltransferase [Candidatus Bathyarchaeota archaeon]|nr:glycosyltransferase [Candidatus Bathyarchaeota archaeon]